MGEGLCCWNAKGIYIYIYRYCGPGIVDFIPVELDVQPRSDLPGSGLAPANPCPCIYRRLGLSAERMRHRVRLTIRNATTLHRPHRISTPCESPHLTTADHHHIARIPFHELLTSTFLSRNRNLQQRPQPAKHSAELAAHK